MAGVKGRSGGRNAKTRAQLSMDGTFRPDRHAGLSNPEPPSGKPEPPKVLEGDALEEWNRMVGRLEVSRTLTKVDDAVLYQYCRLFAETEALAVSQLETASSIDIMEENLSGLEGSELVQAFQEITKLRQLESRYGTQIRQGRMALRTYLVEFGMTPAARSRVKVTGEDEQQPKSALASLQQRAKAIRLVR